MSKHDARKLRRQGLLINDIASKLKISKSTVSRWVTDIECPERLRPRKDIVGQRFGLWQVIEIAFKKLYRNGKESNCHTYFWKCKCLNCGIMVNRPKTALRREQGCRNCDGLPAGESGFRRLLNQYKKSSKQFDLTEEQFRSLTSSRCHYCGAAPERVEACNRNKPGKKSHWGDYKFNGIDRIDNGKHYCAENCVSCCYVCNRAKNNLGYDEFVSYLKRVCNHHAGDFNAIF